MHERIQCTSGQECSELVGTGVLEFLDQMMAATYAARLIGLLLISAGLTPQRAVALLAAKDRACRNMRRFLAALIQPADLERLLVRPFVTLGTQACRG